MNKTEIVNCICDHKGQDELHGKNRRVANLLDGGKSPKKTYKCTVCGREHTVKQSERR